MFDEHDVANIAAHYEKHGYAVVQTCDPLMCRQAIAEQVKKILLAQPWMKKLVVKDRATGEVLDIDLHEERYVKELITPGIPAKARKHYDDVWPMHKTFGACCDPSAFHLHFQWKLRQKESLYIIATAIMKNGKLFVALDRCIQKAPGKGEPEFLHWDLNVQKMEDRLPDDLQPNVCIKVCFTEAEFICVPGTHTQKFAEEFNAEYGPLYPNVKKGASKFGMDPAKPDPMKLREKREAIKLPAGCAIFWSPYMLHGTKKSPTNGGVTFGMYMGYLREINRPGYTSDRLGIISEIKDRFASYKEGRAPKLFPSMDEVHYMPKCFSNYPDQAERYVRKTPPGYKGRSTREVKSGKNKGRIYEILVPVLDPNYVPPELDMLGKRLLGIEPHPEPQPATKKPSV